MKQLTKFATVLLALLLCSVYIFSQTNNQGVIPPPSFRNSYSYANLDPYYENVSKSNFDYTANTEKTPLKVGFSITTSIKPSSNGKIVKWNSSEQSWMIKVTAPDAPALGLVIENAKFPENAILYVYAENDPTSYYSIKGNEIFSGYISTPPIVGESIIVEYSEPITSRNSHIKGSFDITEIVVIYRGLYGLDSVKGVDDSEACHVNINCSPEGDAWKTYKRGVAKIYFREGSSWYVCSGTLINNARNDGKPYFLTADHCGGAASTSDRSVWQFHFNFERPSCDNNSTPSYSSITGCTLKARGLLAGGSDFQLVELNSAPPLTWFPYYNGWDRSTTAASSGVSIHHPQGDIKKISTYTETLTTSTPTIDGQRMADNSTWRVYWKATTNGHGVTEGGSSGSPIFNSLGQVIGTLSGGGASCTSLTSPDYYGKFNYHWASNGTTSSSKLQPWLDPDNSNVMSLSGFDPNGTLYANFETNKTSAKIGEQITLTDLSTGATINTWAWNFGAGASPASANTKGPHIISYTSSGLKTVSLTINGTSTTTKTDFINIIDVPLNTVLFEGFEGGLFPPAGWLSIDADGDSHNWFAYGAEGSARSGLKCAGSASWDEDAEALTPSNWLITPQIDVTTNNFKLEYYISSQDKDWPREKYGVFVSTTNNSITSFTQVFAETLQDGNWYKREVNLSSYVGQKIYIAFRHFDCTDMFILKLDDVLVTGGATSANPIMDEQLVRIFPNPFDNSISIKNISNINRIIIKDVVGKDLAVYYPNNIDEVVLETTTFQAGLYIVIFETKKNEWFTKKIVKH